MKDIFILFYAVLFGALLSAEIGDDHFKVPGPSTATAWVAWAWRIGWLVIVRAGYFAFVYTRVSWLHSNGPDFTTSTTTAALLLCSPILGFQQLSYGIIPHASFRPPRDSEKWRASWLVTGLVFGLLIPGVVLCAKGW